MPRKGLKFRNYTPQGVVSDPSALEDKKPDGGGASKAPALLPTQKLALELKQLASHSAPAPLGSVGGGQLVSAAALAPKKPNEDLKRELQPALDELAIRTQEAITTLVQQKMAKQVAQEAQGQVAASSGSGEAIIDEKSNVDGPALARMVEAQAEEQGKHLP